MVWGLFTHNNCARCINHTYHLRKEGHKMKEPTRLYTGFSGIFLLLQGTSTLAFRLFPALDQAFPPLLAVTQMIPAHSLLHIFTGVIALIILLRGDGQG